MRLRDIAMLATFMMTMMSCNGEAATLDQFRWEKRVLVVVAPKGDPAADAQRRIYTLSESGMSEREIVLTEALGDGDASKQIRSRLSADGNRFQVFLIGKDGNTAFFVGQADISRILVR